MNLKITQTATICILLVFISGCSGMSGLLDLKSDMPKNTLVAIRNNARNPKFTANVVVLKNDLSEEVPTIDYARALREKMKSTLNSYKEISVEPKSVKVQGREVNSLFIYVEGRLHPEDDLKRYMQVAAVKGKNVYVVAAAGLANEKEDVFKKLETIVKSFEVK